VVHFLEALAACLGDGPASSVAGASNLEPRTPCWCLGMLSGGSGLQALGSATPPAPLALLGPPTFAARPGRWGDNHRAWPGWPGQLVVPNARRLQRGPPDSSRRVVAAVAAVLGGDSGSRASGFSWRSCCQWRPRPASALLQIVALSGMAHPTACQRQRMGGEALLWRAC